MRRILSTGILLLALNFVQAQNRKIDSLLQIALRQSKAMAPKPEPNRDSLLKQLAFVKLPAGRIKLIYDIIMNYGELNSKDALYYHHKILDLTKRLEDNIGEAVILSELGYTVAQNGDQAEGMKLIVSALQLAKKTGNNQAIGIVYDNLGVVSTNNSIKKNSFMKAVAYSHAGNDDLFECFALNNLSNVLRAEHKTDSARSCFQKTLELAVSKNIQQMFPILFAIIAADQKSPVLKLKYLKFALQLPDAKIDNSVTTGILSEISATYFKDGKKDSALFYAKKAYNTSIKALFPRRIYPAFLLTNLYKGNNADSALKYAVIYFTARDSTFNSKKNETAQALAFAQQQREQEATMQKQVYQNNLRTYFLIAVIAFFVIIAFIYWRNNRLSNLAKAKIEQTLDELKTAQKQLIQSEKMASLGELTAGIAHEIQNPLNFVNNFSEVNTELIDEMQQEIGRGDFEEVRAIASDIKENQIKISQHGKRADFIVKGMLQHSRSSTGERQLTDINILADEFLKLSYHGLKAKDKSFNAVLTTHLDDALPQINIVQQDIGRVLLNLFNNAFYAVNEKKKARGDNYNPEVSVSTSVENNQVVISVKDNGIGIPDAIKDKIMQPFFTTKPAGEGTGLGLSLSYDIVVKGHGGKMEINTHVNDFTEMMIYLPI